MAIDREIAELLLRDDHLTQFVHESNRIEGITRYPTKSELDATRAFVRGPEPDIGALQRLVMVLQPDAKLRDRVGLDVRVGNHVPPPGGPEIPNRLGTLLHAIGDDLDPWRAHVEYETLHPFTDGNGRSGRALWAWQMVRRQRGLPLGFLHQWYYQTLERCGLRSQPPRGEGG